jgi:hypothetical protein
MHARQKNKNGAVITLSSMGPSRYGELAAKTAMQIMQDYASAFVYGSRAGDRADSPISRANIEALYTDV